MNLKCLVLVVITLVSLRHADNLCGQDWPQFRGPEGNGVLKELQHPQKWGDDVNVAWSIDLQGGGLSSPIVQDNRIFLTTAIGPKAPVSFAEGVRDMRPKQPGNPVKFQVNCYSLKDGEKLWERTIAEKRPEYPIHASNSYATESPATDGVHLFVYFAAIGTVAALDFEGNEIWRQELGSFPTGNGFGTGSSLTTGDGNVFVQCDNDKSSFVVALDAATGKQVWRKDRSGRTSWSTPLFWKNSLRSELVACGSGFVTSYDPKTGDELWKLSDIGMSFSASPALDDQRIYFGNSGPMSSGPLVAVSAGMQGNQDFKPDSKLRNVDWSVMRAGPGMSSPVSVNGYLYIPSRGKLTCYSCKDGSVVFKERMDISSMAASMWAAGDRVFMMDESGKTLALQTGPESKIVEVNQINDDLFWSTPAVSGNSLLIRGVKKLYCIRQ